jgi:hypothetical protein
MRQVLVGRNLVLPVPSHQRLSPVPAVAPAAPSVGGHSSSRRRVIPSRCGFSTDTRTENPAHEGITPAVLTALLGLRSAERLLRRVVAFGWPLERRVVDRGCVWSPKSTTRGNARDCGTAVQKRSPDQPSRPTHASQEPVIHSSWGFSAGVRGENPLHEGLSSPVLRRPGIRVYQPRLCHSGRLGRSVPRVVSEPWPG